MWKQFHEGRYSQTENSPISSDSDGLTGNTMNTATDYQNGIDWHTDWGASRFLSEQLHVGIVGYL
jgi:hypothetical protein